MITKIIEINPFAASGQKDIIWSDEHRLEISDPLVFIEPCELCGKFGNRCYFLKDGATYNYFTIHQIIINH